MIIILPWDSAMMYKAHAAETKPLMMSTLCGLDRMSVLYLQQLEEDTREGWLTFSKHLKYKVLSSTQLSNLFFFIWPKHGELPKPFIAKYRLLSSSIGQRQYQMRALAKHKPDTDGREDPEEKMGMAWPKKTHYRSIMRQALMWNPLWKRLWGRPKRRALNANINELVMGWPTIVKEAQDRRRRIVVNGRCPSRSEGP